MFHAEIAIVDIEQFHLLGNPWRIELRPPYADDVARRALCQHRAGAKGAGHWVVARRHEFGLDLIGTAIGENLSKKLLVSRHPRAGDIDQRAVLVEENTFDRHRLSPASG